MQQYATRYHENSKIHHKTHENNMLSHFEPCLAFLKISQQTLTIFIIKISYKSCVKNLPSIDIKKLCHLGLSNLDMDWCSMYEKFLYLMKWNKIKNNFTSRKVPPNTAAFNGFCRKAGGRGSCSESDDELLDGVWPWILWCECPLSGSDIK